MNKTHRIVWSETRKAFVVAHEKAAANGKPASTRTIAAQAVTAALLAIGGLGAGQAMADSCTGNTSISPPTPVTDQCVLDGTASLTVASGGVLTVSGSIYPAGIAVTIAGGVTSDSISNAGTISGGVIGIELLGTTASGASLGSITNDSGAKIVGGVINISSGSNGIAVYQNSTITGTVSNSGTISGNSSAILINNVSTIGGLINAAAGRLEGGYVITIANNSFLGSLRNDGTMVGGSGGLSLSRSTISGGITNSGLIEDGRRGTLQLANNAIVQNGIVNSGALNGRWYGISADRSTVDFLNNGSSGTISGSSGIYLNGATTISAGLTNSGLIRGTGNRSAGINMMRGTTVNSGITNSGQILGVQTALNINRSNAVVNGGITNSGTISASGNGTTGYGIHIFSSSTVNGGIINSGTISGISGTSGGTISGAIYVDSVTSSLDGITIAGSDTAKFIGPIVAPSTPVTVAGGAAYTMDNGQQFTVSGFTNAGTLGVVAGGTGTITGNYVQSSATVVGTLRTNLNSSAQFGKVSVSGTATIPANAVFDVLVNPTTCGGLTTSSGALTGVITATTISGISVGTLTGAMVSDNCAAVDFVAVSTGTAINLVPVTPTWAVTGATNNAGWGSVSCVSPVTNNGTATCTGSVSGGYQLNSAAGSTLCGAVSVSGNTITAGPVTGACTVTGTFGSAAPATWAVTGATNNSAWGTVNCTSPVTNGNYASCTASPAPSYRLVSASGCGTTTISGNAIAAGPVTAACSVTGTFAAINNGACGSSANMATEFLPTVNLCSVGTAEPVTAGTSSWAWSCTGSGPGATNATCSAPYPVVNGGGGTVGAIQTPGTNGWQIDQALSGFVALLAPAPAGVTFPIGATKVVLITGARGTSTTVTLRFSSIPTGAQLYKYGKENGIGDTNKWFAYPATIDVAAGTVTYTLTDGQKGDNDWTENSVIDDPVALSTGSLVANSATSIPTLSEWGLIILSTLMALFGLVWTRRRQGLVA